MIVLDAIVRGAGIGVALLLCLLLVRRGSGLPIVRYGVLFGLGVSSYLICSALWFANVPSILRFPILLFCMMNPLLFWLFARALFDDDFRLGRLETTVISIFSIVVALRLYVRIDETTVIYSIVGVMLQLLGLALVLHILFEIAQGRKTDLLEHRRRFRILVSMTIAAYMVIIVIAELVLEGTSVPQYLATLNASAILIMAAGITAFLSEVRGSLVPTPSPKSVSAAMQVLDPVGDPALIEAIVSAMENDRLYRTEGLTVPDLAARLNTQEYVLRKAINQSLGHRNFSTFLSTYRLPEIAGALADPAQQKTPILTLALDAGYSSIGPFNRAFKQSYSVTPSEYRRIKNASNSKK